MIVDRPGNALVSAEDREAHGLVTSLDHIDFVTHT